MKTELSFYKQGDTLDLSKTVELVVQSVTALAAAYAGARYAFITSREREDAKQRDAELHACNQAMLTLSRQFNRLLNVQAQFLEPFRSNPARHFLVPATDEIATTWEVDAASMAFLVATDAHDIPFMLTLLSDRFHGAMRALEVRSKLHSDFQLALETSLRETPPRGSGDLVFGEVEHRVGERLTVAMRKATDQVFELVDEALGVFEKAGRDVPGVLRTLYPGKKIFGFTSPPLNMAHGVAERSTKNAPA